MDCYVYLMQCCDGSYYAGWTTDPEKREKTHNSGKGAKYTRSRRPVKLVYTELCENKSTALKREIELKSMSHAQKEQLVRAGIAFLDA